MVRMPPCHGGGHEFESRPGRHYASVAQLPQFDSVLRHHVAEIAQLVEHNLAKVGVASSSLVFRSIVYKRRNPFNVWAV